MLPESSPRLDKMLPPPPPPPLPVLLSGRILSPFPAFSLRPLISKLSLPEMKRLGLVSLIETMLLSFGVLQVFIKYVAKSLVAVKEVGRGGEQSAAAVTHPR